MTAPDRPDAPDTTPLPFRRVVFVSQTTATAEQQGILHGLSQAANRVGDITGLLIYGDGRFLQYLEGTDRSVEQILAGVRRDPLHDRLAVLLDEPAHERLFTHSAGGRLEVDSVAWRRLLEADWPTMERLNRDSPRGLEVLVDLARHPMGSAEQAAHSERAHRARGRFLLKRDQTDRAMGLPEKLMWGVGVVLMGAVLVLASKHL